MINQPTPHGFVRNLAGQLSPIAVLNDGMQPTSTEPRLLIVMGYYNGDLARVIKTCELIADLETGVNPVADFMLFARYDAGGFPDDTLTRLRQKFKTVHLKKSGRHGATGFPYGANEMWHDLVNTMSAKTWHERYYAFFNMEWDAVPIRRGWVQELDAAWKTAKKEGKSVLGVHQPTPILHVNGVAVYDTKLALIAPNQRLSGCNPQGAYDVEHREIIVPMSKHTDLIKLDYRRSSITAAELLGAKDGSGPCVYHGVQDDSAINAVRDEIVNGKARAVTAQSFAMPVAACSPVRLKNETHTLFIRSYAKDFPFLKYCLQSIDKYVLFGSTGFNQVKIVAPESDLRETVETARHFTPCEADPCKGYLAQQITKLYADKFVPDDGWITYIDSDCVFTGPVSPDTFFHDGKPIALYQAYTELKEQTPWKAITEKALGFTVEHEFMRRHGATYHTSELAEFRQWFLANRGVSVRDYIIAEANAGRNFSEFNAMGAWLFRYKHGSRAWFKTEKQDAPALPLRQFYSWGGIDAAKAEIEALLGTGAVSVAPAVTPAPAFTDTEPVAYYPSPVVAETVELPAPTPQPEPTPAPKPKRGRPAKATAPVTP